MARIALTRACAVVCRRRLINSPLVVVAAAVAADADGSRKRRQRPQEEAHSPFFNCGGARVYGADFRRLSPIVLLARERVML